MRLLLALLVALALSAAPAFAQTAPDCTGSGDATAGCTSAAEPTVGAPDVITDPADEVDDIDEPDQTDESDEQPAPVEPEDPRAEQHVLSDSATATSEDGAASDSSGTADQAAAAAPAPAAPSGQLPFTGVDAWLIALAGSLLVAAGLQLRRRVT